MCGFIARLPSIFMRDEPRSQAMALMPFIDQRACILQERFIYRKRAFA